MPLGLEEAHDTLQGVFGGVRHAVLVMHRRATSGHFLARAGAASSVTARAHGRALLPAHGRLVGTLMRVGWPVLGLRTRFTVGSEQGRSTCA